MTTLNILNPVSRIKNVPGICKYVILHDTETLLMCLNLEMGLITRILIRVRIRVRNVITEAETDEERDVTQLA